MLEQDSPAARRKLFDHIRTMLVDQLGKRQPPPSSIEIRQQRAALEVAIKKIEMERASTPLVVHDSRRSSIAGKGHAKSVPAYFEAARILLARLLHKSQKARRPIRGVLLPTMENLRRRLSLCVALFRRCPALARDFVKRSRDGIIGAKRVILSDKRTFSDNRQIRSSDVVDRKCGISSSGTPGPLSLTQNSSGAEPASATIFQNSTGFQLLDRLVHDAAQPTATGEIAADARIVLSWLGVRTADAMTASHYDQFAMAVRTYTIECQEQSERLAPITTNMPGALNDDVRGVLSRLLEREQTERMVDMALTWFGYVWIGSFVVLNLIAVVLLLIVAPSLWLGLAKLVEIYSPLNLSTWIAELGAVSPALLAIAWKKRRERRPGELFPKLGLGAELKHFDHADLATHLAR